MFPPTSSAVTHPQRKSKDPLRVETMSIELRRLGNLSLAHFFSVTENVLASRCRCSPWLCSTMESLV